MHGIRRPLIEQQAESIGISLEKVLLSPVSSNEEYDAKMREMLERHQKRGVSTVVFGDIYLTDVRKYREERLALIGMKAVFPLWGRDTAEMARTFIRQGFSAVITCVDTEQMDPGYAGRAFDEEMLASLPEGVDPCGENGEFHSFVYDGPIFTRCTKGGRPARCTRSPGNVTSRPNGYVTKSTVCPRSVRARIRWYSLNGVPRGSKNGSGAIIRIRMGMGARSPEDAGVTCRTSDSMRPCTERQ